MNMPGHILHIIEKRQINVFLLHLNIRKRDTSNNGNNNHKLFTNHIIVKVCISWAKFNILTISTHPSAAVLLASTIVALGHRSVSSTWFGWGVVWRVCGLKLDPTRSNGGRIILRTPDPWSPNSETNLPSPNFQSSLVRTCELWIEKEP